MHHIFAFLCLWHRHVQCTATHTQITYAKISEKTKISATHVHSIFLTGKRNVAVLFLFKLKKFLIQNLQSSGFGMHCRLFSTACNYAIEKMQISNFLFSSKFLLFAKQKVETKKNYSNSSRGKALHENTYPSYFSTCRVTF